MFFAPVVRTRASSPAYRSFDQRFEKFVNDAFFASASGTPTGFDFKEDDKAWTVTLDVPGIAKEDLTIGIEGAVVRIETKAEAKRQFAKGYKLPQEIDTTASSAKVENGVLELTLVKKVPVSNVTQLTIN